MYLNIFFIFIWLFPGVDDVGSERHRRPDASPREAGGRAAAAVQPHGAAPRATAASAEQHADAACGELTSTPRYFHSRARAPCARNDITDKRVVC